MRAQSFKLQDLVAGNVAAIFSNQANLSESELKTQLSELEEQIATDANCVLEDRNWQLLLLCLSYAPAYSSGLFAQFIEIISLGLTALIRNSNGFECESVEKYIFVLYCAFPHYIPVLGSKQQSSDGQYPQPMPVAVKLMQAMQELIRETHKIEQLYVSCNVERDTLLKCVVKIVDSFLEYGSGIPNSSTVKRSLCELYGSIVLLYPSCKQAISAFLLHAFQCFEDSGELTAMTLCLLINDAQNESFSTEFLRSLCDIEGNGVNFTSEVCSKNTASFFTVMARLSPRFVLKMFSLLAIFFQQENYSLRNALLDCICNFIVEKHIDSNQESTLKSLLNILLERIQDTNSYVRSKALTILSSVCSSNQLPAVYLQQAWKKSVQRLSDKASIVRKKALVLLSDIVKNHPFNFDGGELDGKYFQTRISQLNEAIDRVCTPENELIQHKNAQPKSDEQVEKLLVQRKYYMDAVEFSESVGGALQIVVDCFIFCPNKTEVNEAIEFISICHLLKVTGSQEALAKILPLVWSKDATGDDSNKRSIREHLLSAISVLLFEGSNSEQVACNLEQFYRTFGQKFNCQDCIEEIFSLCLEKKLINKQVLGNLWSHLYVANKQNDAIAVLCMCVGTADGHTGTEERICKLLLHFQKETNRDTRQEMDSSFTHYLCKFIQNSLSQPTNKQTILKFLEQIIVKKSTDSSWMPAVECAINCLFIVGEDPVSTLEDVISKLAAGLVRSNEPASINSSNVDNFSLGKFLFVLGHCSVKFSRYLNNSAPLLRKRLSTGQPSSTQALDEVVGKISVDESIHELFGLIRDIELLYDPNSIFYNFLTLPIKICEGMLQEGTKDPLNSFLFSMASICLSKFMSISENYCRQNLPLFIQLMTCCNSAQIRANLIIAFGDFCTSFNHLVEPIVCNLFQLIEKQQGKSDTEVRINALLVVSWLILNGMIKTKGQLHQIALCFLDTNQTIFQLSCSFFQDLAMKDSNVIYNNIPDIISNLSQNQRLNEDHFTLIMTRIFNLLKKDKQIDNICAKIIQRLIGCTTQRTSKYLVLCLLLLNQSVSTFVHEQRIIFKIVENWEAAFQDKLLSNESLHVSNDDIVQENDIGTEEDAESIRNMLREFVARGKKNDSTLKVAIQLENLLECKMDVVDGQTENGENLDVEINRPVKAIESGGRPRPSLRSSRR